MNTYSYDLPLQHVVRAKLNPPKSKQLIASPINDQFQIDTESTYKYDLPCQRNHDQFFIPRTCENRPAIIKNNVYDLSKYINSTAKTDEIDLSKHVLTTVDAENIRIRVGSIYEKLLEENKRKCEIDQIVTQATFKPKQLKRSLSSHNKSVGQNMSRFNNEKARLSSQSKTNLKDKKSMNTVKKLDYDKVVKTKYEKILEEHFQTKFSSKKSETTNPDEIRLSKICGKNSAILKLKQKLDSKFGTNNSRAEIADLKQKLERVNRDPQILKTNPYQQKKSALKNIKQQQEQEQNKLKKSQSQRWMSMNFYERQQRVLSNRKQKEALGKQQKIDEEIKPCTFKPELVTKIKPLKTQQPQKNSYLTQYYEKTYRRY